MNDAYDTWLSVLQATALLALCWALLWSVLGLNARRNDVADIAWGLTFPMLALLAGGAVVVADWDAEPRAVLVTVLVSIWALRLASHIARRVINHEDEDNRYAAMRSNWGAQWWWRSILQVFVLQAAIALVVAQPVLIAVDVLHGDAQLGWIDAIATILFCAGFVLEAVADRQLRRFLERKAAGDASGYLTSGVWAWSRHPNYAGDAILWWGLGAFGIAGALDSDAPWLIIPALIGPIVMTLLLRYGSGVPITERGRAGSPEWDTYVARTSTFFPRPRR